MRLALQPRGVRAPRLHQSGRGRLLVHREFPFAPRGAARHGARFRSMSDTPPDISHDQHAVRRQKLAELRAAGSDPFRANFATTHFSGEAIKAYVDGKDNE